MWFSILVVMNYYLSIKHKTDTSTLQPSGLWMFLKLPSSVQSTTLDTIVEFPAMDTALHFQRYCEYFHIFSISEYQRYQQVWYSYCDILGTTLMIFVSFSFFPLFPPLVLSHQEKIAYIWIHVCTFSFSFLEAEQNETMVKLRNFIQWTKNCKQKPN